MLLNQRSQRLIKSAIHNIGLDLSGLNILTEVGSGHFIYTPLIALHAHAAKVFAWVNDSQYGLAKDIISTCKKLALSQNLDLSRIEFSANKRPDQHIAAADIITNLGMVRPIDKNFIKKMKNNAVIAYMCESWEKRESDIDFAAVKNAQIPIAGTWENHPKLNIFTGCGILATKIALNAGFEIYQNKILIISSDHFGETIQTTFEKIGASQVMLIKPENILNTKYNDWDFIFLADYTSDTVYIGKNGILNNCSVPIVHLAGRLDYFSYKYLNIPIFPKKSGHSHKMSETLSYLGPKPVIDLHTAGLKVGESLFKKQICEFLQVM